LKLYLNHEVTTIKGKEVFKDQNIKTGLPDE